MEDKKRKQNREEEDGSEEDREKERANKKEIFNPKVILLRSPIKGSSQNERAANKQKIIEVAVKEAIGAMVESVQDSTTIEEDEEEATEVEVEKKRGNASLAFIRHKLDEIEEATSRHQSGKVQFTKAEQFAVKRDILGIVNEVSMIVDRYEKEIGRMRAERHVARELAKERARMLSMRETEMNPEVKDILEALASQVTASTWEIKELSHNSIQ
nr:microfibrillar-associated protein 1-like [Leptinotarsa decemlineata]XP_023019836.1 microfibrillar-associated protein 1-like [Leptinotarsa decemlineata]